MWVHIFSMTTTDKQNLALTNMCRKRKINNILDQTITHLVPRLEFKVEVSKTPQKRTSLTHTVSEAT